MQFAENVVGQHLVKRGTFFGYDPQPTKSWLIVKQQYKTKAKDIFQESNVKISTSGE